MAPTSELITLYSYFRSSASYRVRIALNLKKLKYDYEAIHLVNDGGEQNKSGYKKVNPIGEVPTIIDGGNTISQSMAIIQYLEEKYPKPALFPTSSVVKAKVIQFCENINASMQPLQNLRVLNQLEKQFGADHNAKKEWIQFFAVRGFESLEVLLQDSAGEYCFGDGPSVADCFLVPQMFSVRRWDIDLAKFPIMSRIEKSCLALEAFQKAQPESQPDYQK